MLRANKRQYFVLVALICFALLFSCRAKETTVQTTQTSDTLITKSFDYVSQPISTTITIDEICDSLGTVRNFRQVETSGGNKAKVYTKDNTLSIDLLTGLSQFKTDTIYKTQFKDVYKDKEVIKYRTPLWMWITIVSMAVIILLLLGVKFRF